MASTIYIIILALAASAAARSYNNLSSDAVVRGNLDQYGPYYQGDMRFGEGQLMQAKSGINGEQYRWPDARVFVKFSPSFTRSETDEIIRGMQLIMDKTCIRFYYAQSSNRDYINILRGSSGCWSYVGRQGGRQDLNLQGGSPGCITPGIAAHELIHAIGFYHEQSRYDRDDYVFIQKRNIQSGMEHNFDKYDPNQVNTFGVPYDIKSIMHYDQYAFTNNGQPTIVPRDRNIRGEELGQREGLSEYDAQKLNRMYGC